MYGPERPGLEQEDLGTGLSWSVEHAHDRLTVNTAGPAAGLPNSRRLLRKPEAAQRQTGGRALYLLFANAE